MTWWLNINESDHINKVKYKNLIKPTWVVEVFILPVILWEEQTQICELLLPMSKPHLQKHKDAVNGIYSFLQWPGHSSRKQYPSLPSCLSSFSMPYRRLLVCCMNAATAQLWIKPSHLLPPPWAPLSCAFYLTEHDGKIIQEPENNVVPNDRGAKTSRCQLTRFKHSTLNWIIMWNCQKRESKEKRESGQGHSLS